MKDVIIKSADKGGPILKTLEHITEEQSLQNVITKKRNDPKPAETT